MNEEQNERNKSQKKKKNDENEERCGGWNNKKTGMKGKKKLNNEKSNIKMRKKKFKTWKTILAKKKILKHRNYQNDEKRSKSTQKVSVSFSKYFASMFT